MYYHGEKANQVILGEILVKKVAMVSQYNGFGWRPGKNKTKKQHQRNILYDCVE